ncbi:hypothetical protein CEP52_010827 [Fusarium oligoseptatum]|uniref:Uncharacterized protein n=1 Tax=Fusarium oligoseptatum TaxID=2604345 RepID=A0A428T694_9HYPO|nr:hypothetical protein CEP52_010827 [Fusarium oligoseptatum]
MPNNTDYQKRISSELLGKSDRDFRKYFEFYDQLVADTEMFALQVEHPQPHDLAPVSHDEIMVAAKLLRENPAQTLDNAIQKLQKELKARHSTHQIRLAVIVAVRAMLMLDPAVSDRYGPGYAIGHYRHVSWQTDERLDDFVSRCFPKAPKESERVAEALADKRSLKAWKLESRLGIMFKKTDNLAQHLLLDPENNILYLFHHATFLQMQLARLQTQNAKKEEDVTTCLESGCLPPRLLAETLHSLQSILFHWNDRPSSSILGRLIRRRGFDEACDEPEGLQMFDDSQERFQYLYWGERLATLHDFVVDRPPRNKFERWVKWQTSDSNAFFIALLALAVSILVGLLSLGLSGLQAWIAWKAWKEPNSPPDA